MVAPSTSWSPFPPAGRSPWAPGASATGPRVAGPFLACRKSRRPEGPPDEGRERRKRCSPTPIMRRPIPSTALKIPFSVVCALKEADVIYGSDTNRPGKGALFFGREVLGKIIRSDEAMPLCVFHLKLDFNTDQLEYLYAAVRVLKGSCCYVGFPQPSAN